MGWVHVAKEETIAEDDDDDGHITQLGYFTRRLVVQKTETV